MGRPCLIAGFSAMSEAGASLLDERLQLGLVPITKLVQLSSPSFHYHYSDRMAFEHHGTDLPQKVSPQSGEAKIAKKCSNREDAAPTRAPLYRLDPSNRFFKGTPWRRRSSAVTLSPLAPAQSWSAIWQQSNAHIASLVNNTARDCVSFSQRLSIPVYVGKALRTFNMTP